MNSDLDKIQAWLKLNKLTPKVKKTKYILKGSRLKLDLVRLIAYPSKEQLFINPLESWLTKI